MQHTVLYAKLNNGAEGLFIDVPGSSVTSMDLAFRAGDYLSPKGKMDTAHLMEHLVLGANKKYPSSKEFSHEFTKYGAYNNAYTGDYHMGYEAECEASETLRILNLLCIAIESPLFTKEDFKAEMGNVREELKMRRNYNDSELSLALQDAMGFVPISYRQRSKELDNITLEDVKSHYKKTHFASNLRFVISGPISSIINELKKRIDDLDIPKGSGLIGLPNEVPKTLKTPLFIKNARSDNLTYRWEVILPLIKSNIKRDSITSLNDISFNGFDSRVFGELREKGLVYGILSNYYETKNNSIYVINGQVQLENIEQVFKTIIRELSNIALNGVKKEELSDLRPKAYGEFKRFYQTAGQLCNWYRLPFLTRNEIAHFSQYRERLDQVTTESISDISKEILSSKISGLGIMAPKKDISLTKLSNILNVNLNER